MWALRILLILTLAVAVNVVFWAALPRYGVEAPAWFVIAFDVLFVLPVFWLLPSVRSRRGGQVGVAAAALARWGKGTSEFPTVDESRGRLHRAGWSVGEMATASTWRVCGGNEDMDQPYCLLRAERLGLPPGESPRLGKPAHLSWSVGRHSSQRR
jgi:hypothetical protein